MNENFTCSICNKRYKTFGGMERHIFAVHKLPLEHNKKAMVEGILFTGKKFFDRNTIQHGIKAVGYDLSPRVFENTIKMGLEENWLIQKNDNKNLFSLNNY